ncbi:MAG: UDP-N-acetylmuramoylalanine-D-glutamate ligase [Candidatus Roizmanbacteria bacterium GW2011_GWA2_36_23]|uniref:UDP-N-acetylmuramoylalanine--D-glutamate ligase n=1 Tax=Candidatus Roizmanbacteria bacterium GW2011_GWA2_36_23 TaxID=1618480 RepID=A0A0G0E8T4_9BACT|nr:MAG: UDP-N-acetylmuramoylalanine-D-glutamate ligase [Candidatus Roizmanbacteria bacterium GW2011_GWA2_36_23]
MEIYTNLIKRYSGKKVLVVGLGVQGGGLGVAKFFAELGAKVTVTDLRSEMELANSIKRLKSYPIVFHLNKHLLQDFLEADIIFKGPSVPWNLPEIIEAEKQNIPIEMELAFFTKHCPAKIIGVTGTRGKSTTTNMIYLALQNAKINCFLAGSLPGISTISLLKSVTAEDWVVMEIPSWPLAAFHRHKISPHIAVFTNFYPDHLNFYKSMDDYLYDKKAIYMYQTPQDYLVAARQLQKIIGNDRPQSQVFYTDDSSFSEASISLPGKHNLENANISLKVLEIVGIDKQKAEKSIVGFKGLPYRQQIVRIKDKVIFINDSTSTTPVATIKAIDTFHDKPIILLLGGKSKNLPYGQLLEKLQGVEKIILLKGSFTDEIEPLLKKQYPDKVSLVFTDMDKAVQFAFQSAGNFENGAYILLSPAATSFAMFKNEFERGDCFNEIVKKI